MPRLLALFRRWMVLLLVMGQVVGFGPAALSALAHDKLAPESSLHEGNSATLVYLRKLAKRRPQPDIWLTTKPKPYSVNAAIALVRGSIKAPDGNSVVYRLERIADRWTLMPELIAGASNGAEEIVRFDEDWVVASGNGLKAARVIGSQAAAKKIRNDLGDPKDNLGQMVPLGSG